MTAPTFTRIAYTVVEAAEACGVSRATIDAAIRNGDLVANYAGAKGGKKLIRAVELDNWVAALPTERPNN